jgi:outer membrane lipoprotein-sorting protein
MRTVFSLVQPVLVYALMTLIVRPASAEEALGPKQILESMIRIYAACPSYSDTGSSRSVFTGPSGNFTIERSFTTALVRPDRFRFECKEKNTSGKNSRYIIFCKGKEVQLWRDNPPGAKKIDSLSTALAQASSQSGGSANTIAALFFPDKVGGYRLTNLSELKRLEDAACGGSMCYRILGKFSAESTMTLWIDNRTFLLRRIDSQRKSTQFNRDQTILYEPVVGAQVPDQSLEFNAPQ